MTYYRYTGNHAHDFQVGDKVLMIGTGQGIELSDEEVKLYQEMLDNGGLIEGLKPIANTAPGGKK